LSFGEDIASRQSRSAGALRTAKKKCFGFGVGSSWFWSWKFAWAKPKAKRSFVNQSFFVSPLAKLGSDNFLIF